MEDGGAARPRHGHGRGPEAGLVLGQRPRHGAQHEGGGGRHEGNPADSDGQEIIYVYKHLPKFVSTNECYTLGLPVEAGLPWLPSWIC